MYFNPSANGIRGVYEPPIPTLILCLNELERVVIGTARQGRRIPRMADAGLNHREDNMTEKTANPSAVARQLGHKNITYSLQYTRITEQEMEQVINDRE